MAKTPDADPTLFGDPEPAAPADPAAPSPVPANFPPSWAAVLDAEFRKTYFTQLRAFVSAERKAGDVFPPAADVFNAFRATPFDAVSVVILGQDPYPTPGHAHGLCFSVRPGVVIPASLRNIYKEMEADVGVPPAKHGHLLSWAEQGVLLLNAVLTVRSGSPASHANKGWETFTDAALAAVNARPTPSVFVLWGGYAQKKAAKIDAKKHVILKAAHPSPLAAHNGFFGSKPFSQVNAALEGFGRTPINWALPPV